MGALAQPPRSRHLVRGGLAVAGEDLWTARQPVPRPIEARKAIKINALRAGGWRAGGKSRKSSKGNF